MRSMDIQRQKYRNNSGGRLTHSQIAIVLVKCHEIHGHFLERFGIVDEIKTDIRQLSDVGDTPLRAISRGDHQQLLPVTGHSVTCLGLGTKRDTLKTRMWRREDMISAKSLVVTSERFALGPHLDCPPPTELSYQSSPALSEVSSTSLSG